MPETFQGITISIAHLPKATADLLCDEGDNNAWVICAPYDCGVLVYVHDDDHLSNVSDAYTQACNIDSPPPAGLQALMEYGAKHGAKWIQLDRDAPEVTDLPIYDW